MMHLLSRLQSLCTNPSSEEDTDIRPNMGGVRGPKRMSGHWGLHDTGKVKEVKGSSLGWLAGKEQMGSDSRILLLPGESVSIL